MAHGWLYTTFEQCPDRCGFYTKFSMCIESLGGHHYTLCRKSHAIMFFLHANEFSNNEHPFSFHCVFEKKYYQLHFQYDSIKYTFNWDFLSFGYDPLPAIQKPWNNGNSKNSDSYYFMVILFFTLFTVFIVHNVPRCDTRVDYTRYFWPIFFTVRIFNLFQPLC